MIKLGYFDGANCENNFMRKYPSHPIAVLINHYPIQAKNSHTDSNL